MPENDLLPFLSWSYRRGAHNQRNIYDPNNERTPDSIFTKKSYPFCYLAIYHRSHFSQVFRTFASLSRAPKVEDAESSTSRGFRPGFIITLRLTSGKYSNESRIFRFHLLWPAQGSNDKKNISRPLLGGMGDEIAFCRFGFLGARIICVLRSSQVLWI